MSEDPLLLFTDERTDACLGEWKNERLQVHIRIQEGRLVLESGKKELVLSEAGANEWSVADATTPDSPVYLCRVHGFGRETRLTLEPPRHKGGNFKATLQRVEHLDLKVSSTEVGGAAAAITAGGCNGGAREDRTSGGGDAPSPPPPGGGGGWEGEDRERECERERERGRAASPGSRSASQESDQRGGGGGGSGRRRAGGAPQHGQGGGGSGRGPRGGGRGGGAGRSRSRSPCRRRSPRRERDENDGDEVVTTLFVSGLPGDAREEEVRQDCEWIGPVVRVVLMRRGSDRNAFVRFASLPDARRSMEKMSDGELQVCQTRVKAEMARRNTN